MLTACSEGFLRERAESTDRFMVSVRVLLLDHEGASFATVAQHCRPKDLVDARRFFPLTIERNRA
jgi:hypothetical protein